jgi:hypothetical protein
LLAQKALNKNKIGRNVRVSSDFFLNILRSKIYRCAKGAISLSRRLNIARRKANITVKTPLAF